MQAIKRQNSILIPLRRDGDELRVYLQRRSADVRVLPSHFGFWGGGAEREETPDLALVREIKEEMGMDLDLSKVELFNRYEFIGSIKYAYLYYPEQGWEKSIVIGEGEYGKWFTTDEAIAEPELILEDKVIINDLERKLLKRPIR